MYKPRVALCSDRIAQALNIRGMKQSELCKLAKVPKSSLSLYLCGAYEPKQNRVYDMARVLNVSEAWLMGYDVPMERQEQISLDETTLTEREKKLLDLFRSLSEEKQILALQMIQVALGNQ